jgi:hypothetical protein
VAAFPRLACRAVRLALAACLALALPCAALAHGGGPVIPDADDALEQGQIYVDYDAKPTLTELEADALGRTLAQKPGVYVAVLPASVGGELQTNAEGVATELASRVDRPGLYIVSLGGRTAAWSTIDGTVYCPNRGSLDQRLTTVVETALPYSVEEHTSRSWRGIGIAGGAALALGAAAATTAIVRRRARSRPSSP